MKTRCSLLTLLAGFAVAAAPAAESPPPPPAGAGENFVLARAAHRVTVRYFSPPGATPQTPVVLVMHGVKRNGEDYLNDWIPLARARHFLVVVPEFSLAEFPGNEGYIYGNTVDAAGHAIPREQWAFSMIEPVFDAVCERTGNRSERYSLYGHSAGAQFVQRFVYFVPDARLARVVSANAGWYMLPDLATPFPYGLKGTPVGADDLRHALALPLVVLLGTADTDPTDKLLRHTPEADAQGPFRFARGQFFFAHAEDAARALHTTLGWRLATAPGVGHSDKGMAPFAVDSLLPDAAHQTHHP